MFERMEILTSKVDSVGTTSPSWQEVMKLSYRDPVELCQLLELGGKSTAAATRLGTPQRSNFPLFAPSRWLDKIEKGNLSDPLLRQILPVDEEGVQGPNDLFDPVGDTQATRSPGLIHKYQGRALLVLTGACGIHCRYCFRRHFAYETAVIRPEHWKQAIANIGSDDSLQEIILSGGDPLTLVDERLMTFYQQLDNIPHVTRIRIHSRMPIVIPERVTDSLVDLLEQSEAVPVLVVHANHARELDSTVERNLRRLGQAGVTLLNQAVLLRGVNDDVDALARLSERLLECRVTPYYLHQLDRVVGASHFEVDEAKGLELIESLRRRLPGYAVPRYVRETAGEPYKEPIVPPRD